MQSETMFNIPGLIQGFFFCQRSDLIGICMYVCISVFTVWRTDTWICLKFQALTDDSLYVSCYTYESMLYIQYHICVEWMLAKKADSSSATDIISGSSVKMEGARCQLLRSYTDCGPLENKTSTKLGTYLSKRTSQSSFKECQCEHYVSLVSIIFPQKSIQVWAGLKQILNC